MSSVIPITVVTIVLNDIAGIQRTFATLREQTFDDAEHVVVDGGSTDGTVDWVKGHSIFARTRILSEPDDGIYDAMNKGLRLATGDIVYFLNAGDRLASPHVLRAVVESFRTKQWVWAVGASQMVDEENRAVRTKMHVSYRWWYRTFWHYNLSQQAVFVRTDVLRDSGGFDCRFAIAGDYHAISGIGRRFKPELLPLTVAYTLAGGISDRRLARAHCEAHRARVDLLAMGPFARSVDACWTGVLIAKVWFRRVVRTALRDVPRLGRRSSKVV